jgi:hypothetical protein
MEPTTATTPAEVVDDEPMGDVVRRIWRTSVASYVLFAIPVTVLYGWRGLAGLTCSAAVVMINFLWLEEIVTTVLQPTPRLHPWRLTLRALARFALLGVALLVTILVARFNAVSVLLGFSIVVVGICGEAVYSLRRSLYR